MQAQRALVRDARIVVLQLDDDLVVVAAKVARITGWRFAGDSRLGAKANAQP
jgi:hypothetical protein